MLRLEVWYKVQWRGREGGRGERREVEREGGRREGGEGRSDGWREGGNARVSGEE